MNEFFKVHIDEVDEHEIKELEHFTFAIEYLSYKYELRPDSPLSYWIDYYWVDQYVSISISFKENQKNIFCYSINHSFDECLDEHMEVKTVLEKQTNDMIAMCKDIDGIITLLGLIQKKN